MQATMEEQKYISAIPEKYRWKNWATEIHNMREQIVHDVFADTYNYMKSGINLR